MMKPTTPQQAAVLSDLKQYVDKGTMLIHSPETRDPVLKMLEGPDPVQKVADATVMIMQRLDAAGRSAGIEVQDAIKIIGAHQLVDQIVEVGEAARKFKLDQDLTHLALSVTIQDYIKIEVSAKRIDPRKLKVALAAEIRQLPPAKRKEVQQSQARIQQIARKYNHGKNVTPQQPVAA